MSVQLQAGESYNLSTGKVEGRVQSKSAPAGFRDDVITRKELIKRHVVVNARKNDLRAIAWLLNNRAPSER